MFHLIPQLIPRPLHRQALRLAHALRKRWWRLRRPRLHGCRVIAADAEGRVLLIRHSYGSGVWMPPGGGLSRGEDGLAGGIRELREETGCGLDGAFEADLVVEDLHGAGNNVHIIAGTTSDRPVADGREIIEARFFALDALPERMPAALRGQLPAWVRAATAGRPDDRSPSPAPPPAPTG